MKKMTLVLALLLCLVMSVLPLSGCKGSTAPGGENVVIDTSKTQLYVRYYAGGLGTDWIEEICSRFEEDFANVSFEEGKTGVQIVPKFEKTQVAADQIRDNNSDVFFMEHMSYSDAVNKGFLLNISDVVKDYAVTGYDGRARSMRANLSGRAGTPSSGRSPRSTGRITRRTANITALLSIRACTRSSTTRSCSIRTICISMRRPTSR